MTARSASPVLDLPIGAHVLIGMRGITMPGDWWPATVLWTDGEEVLVRQGGIAGQNPHNQLHPVSYVRAIGDHGFLREFQERARAETTPLVQAVRDAERGVSTARAAVWTRLDEIGITVPGSETPEVRTARRRREKMTR